MSDPIRQPSHYRAGSGIEAIDVIRAWNLSFSLGSALKYLCRAGLKPGQSARQDLQKALWYVAEELGGKGIANEVAQLVAMELAEGDEAMLPRLPEPVEEEPEPATPEGRTLADYHPAPAPPAVTIPVEAPPDVTPVAAAPIAVAPQDDLTVESVEASNHPAPIVPPPPAPRVVRSQPKPPQPLSEGEITTEGAAKLLGVSTGKSATKYLRLRGISPVRPGDNNRPHVWDRAQVEAVAAIPQPTPSEAARATRARKKADLAAQGLISSEELGKRAGLSSAGIVWNVNHGNLTPQIDAKRGHSHWFTQEEADRFLAARAKLGKGRKASAPATALAPPPAPVPEELPLPGDFFAEAAPVADAQSEEEDEERTPVPIMGHAHAAREQTNPDRANGNAMEAAIREGRGAFAIAGVFNLYWKPLGGGLKEYRTASPRDHTATVAAGYTPIIRLIKRPHGWEEVPLSAVGLEKNVPVVATAPRERLVGSPDTEHIATSATLRRIA